jgi:PBSX family phage portal protein
MAKVTETQSREANALKSKRQELRKIFMTAEQMQEQLSDHVSRQVPIDEDNFEMNGFYAGDESILQPPYSFETLYQYYEESDILQTMVEAMVNNIDGFTPLFQFLGDDVKDRESDSAKAELQAMTDFFSQVNDTQSFRKLRKEMRKELEIIGISGFELIRNVAGKLTAMFHADFKNMRMTRQQKDSTPVKIALKRNGKTTEVIVRKYFRRFCQIDTTGIQLRWFKEYGDPRNLCASTGKYYTDPKKCKPLASEIMVFKNKVGTEAYGLPRWIGCILQVTGRSAAQYVNYDLFENQGIPPLAVMISGGTLNEESLEELQSIVKGMRGIEKWNRIIILESVPNSVGLDDKGNAKIELKNLSEYRADDQMFTKYLDNTKTDVRQRYRLPDLFCGASEAYTHSTSKSSKGVAEEQVFIPEREDFDEIINLQLVWKELGITRWKFVSGGPRIVGAEEISNGVDIFGKAGAFTVNHAIEQANVAFSTSMSKFNAPWADYPLPIVMELIKTGRLKLEELENTEPEVKQNIDQLERIVQLPEENSKVIKLPAVAKQFLEDDAFTEKEKNLYNMLSSLRDLLNDSK